MKAFYAFVECVERKMDPFKTPLVVCDKDRGSNTIVLSVSPYLKKMGVPSRCRYKELPKNIPNMIFAKPRMQLYLEKSVDIVSIFLDFVSKEDLHVYSIDECFLDVTDYLKINNCDAITYAKRILKKIKEKTKLICTCGIGENIFMAKCAMDIEAKNNKNYIAKWTYKDIPTKLWPLSPISKMWGIGSRWEERLNNYGFFTIGEIACSELNFLKQKLGIIGEEIYNHAHGIDEGIIRDKYTPESHSLNCGQVLMRDYDFVEMETIVKDMVEELCEKIRAEKKLAKTIGIVILYSGDLGGFGKMATMLRATDSTKEITDFVLYIYRNCVQDLPIRRINLFASELFDNTFYQTDLFKDENKIDSERKYNNVMDKIKRTYGNNSIVKMSALLPESNAIARNNQIGGHSK